MREPLYRRLLLACAVLFLLTLAWGALSGGLRQIQSAHTVGQRIQTVAQLLCGILSLLVVLACFRWRRWCRPLHAVWTVSLVTAAGLSSLVWGPPLPLIGLLFAAAAGLAALAINWTLRTALPG